MRSDTVFTHYTCNQNCTYCVARRSSDDPAYIRTSAVFCRIDAAIEAGAHEIVLSGGEPTMRRDLPLLVGRAIEGGATSLVLETNATLLDQEAAVRLRARGLTKARINLSAIGAESDALTRDEGGFERTLEGLRACIDAGLLVELSAVVVRSTLASLSELPQRLVEALGGAVELGDALSAIRVKVPVQSADPDELVSYEEAVPVLAALEASARKVGVAVKLSPDSGPPPCVFPAGARVAHLYAMTPGAQARPEHVQLGVCAGCQMADRCSGLSQEYLARHAPPTMKPILEDRVRRRLSLISSVEEQIEREFVQPNRYLDHTTGETVVEHLIRINFHCNQACRFCFVSTHLPPAGDAAVRKAILDACDEGVQVTLTGGEPTLNANLLEYVRMAKERSDHPVAMQTNCIRLADAKLTDALAEAGLEWVQVSLHGTTADLSDAVTEAPGTFTKSVLGIDNLHRHPQIYISINFVITQRNYTDLVPFVRMVATRWPRAFCNISFVAPSSDVVPADESMVPRYSKVLPHLTAAIAEAQTLGVDIGGFESMCGLPLCLVPAERRGRVMEEIPEGYDGGEFVRPAVCGECALNGKCYGVRRGYHALYGASELRRIVEPRSPLRHPYR